MTQVTDIDLDVAIIGGGIAGLWLLNKLLHQGYNACLFEADTLGGQQTMASQGMIHGGVKYALQGKASGASESIADMPAYWRRCLAGTADIDLRQAQVLSDHFYMWSTDSWWSRLMTFGASLSLRGRIEKVKRSERPAIFQTPAFHGGLYRLLDVVLDVPSVISALANNGAGRIFKLDREQAQWHINAQGNAELLLNSGTRIQARQFVLTAGKGNAAILEQLHLDQPRMQVRPLQQVMVKHNNRERFYGHCVTSLQATPRLTISSHPLSDGSQAWYLGGSLAEEGVGKTAEQLIAIAKQELSQLMPWLDLQDAQWQTLPVDRAELAQPGGKRPDNASIISAPRCSNIAAAWPTKLTLAPQLAEQTLTLLRERNIQPSPAADLSALKALRVPEVAATPWQVAFTS